MGITLSFGALARGLKSERSESAHVLASQRPKGVANSVLLGVQRNVRSFAATTSQIDRVFKLLNLR